MCRRRVKQTEQNETSDCSSRAHQEAAGAIEDLEHARHFGLRAVRARLLALLLARTGTGAARLHELADLRLTALRHERAELAALEEQARLVLVQLLGAQAELLPRLAVHADRVLEHHLLQTLTSPVHQNHVYPGRRQG